MSMSKTGHLGILQNICEQQVSVILDNERSILMSLIRCRTCEISKTVEYVQEEGLFVTKHSCTFFINVVVALDLLLMGQERLVCV